MEYGPGVITSHSANGTVKSSSGNVWGIWISSTLNDPGSVLLRDGGASGTVKATLDIDGNVASPAFHGNLPIHIQFNTDIYIECPTGVKVQLLWE